ncbi:MAG: Por secretion system C-terminal sorting protein [Hymenobacter sp.]|nr:Por secretion system C-terminal sorting protein [Hymenobacter sp.]
MNLPVLCAYRALPLLFALGFVLISHSMARAQTPFFGTAISVGNTQAGVSYVGGMAVDAQGNTYVGGTFGGTLSFGNQPLTSRQSLLDVFVAKYDAIGNFVWVASAGSDASDYALGLALDAGGNVYITGHYASAASFGTMALPVPAGGSDAFVAKLDPAGNWLWATRGGGTADDTGTALAVDAAGAVTLVGSFSSPTAAFGTAQLTNVLPGPSGLDTFVARLSAGGNWLGATAAGGPGADPANAVALDAAGNAYVCGTFSGATMNFGGSLLTNNAPANGANAYVAMITPAGNWQWATRAAGRSSGLGIAVGSSGAVYVTGGFAGTTAFGAAALATPGTALNSDIFVAALDAAGAWQWATRAGGSGDEAGSGLALDDAGRIVVTGEFFSPTAQFGTSSLNVSGTSGNSDAFIAKLDATGSWQWALASIAPEEEIGHALALAPDGGMHMAGTYLGRAILGSTTLPGTQPVNKVFLTTVYDKGPLAIVGTLAPGSGAPGQTVTVTGSGFAGATAVLFNGAPAASFAVQSATQLTAVVPVGVTAGPVSVRTSAGTGTSASAFQPTALATAAPTAAEQLFAWPNPAGPADFIQVRLPNAALRKGITCVELRNTLGQVVREMQFRGQAVSVPVLGLASGVYQLVVFPTGQRSMQQRVVVGK